MTDLNALVVFAKVVEAKSFSEAARRLGMPVSTVSRRVAELEDQLGVRLLDRSTRNLRLTDLGSEVLEHAQRSAEASEAVQNIVSNRQSSVSGTLRLSAPPNISDTLLSPLVTAFHAKETQGAYVAGLQSSGAPVSKLVADISAYEHDEAAASVPGTAGFDALSAAPKAIAVILGDLKALKTMIDRRRKDKDKGKEKDKGAAT